MSAARQREAEQATLALQLALAQLGVAATAEALDLWQSVPTSGRAPSSDRWLNAAVRNIMVQRGVARALARAYYRLVRALLTGYTVGDPDRNEPATVTLGDLRAQFAALVAEQPEVDPDTGEVLNGPEAQPQRRADDSERIPIEGGFADPTASDRDAEDEARTNLAALGPKSLSKKLDAIDASQPASDVDKQRDQAHGQAGAQQAAAYTRIAINGARSESWQQQESDKRALGWVRVSRTGTPCGWCAMLISRGFIEKNSSLYVSENSASYKGGSDRAATNTYEDGDRYHDNCQCYSVPIFSKEQLSSDALFALNREYGVMWPKVTQGLSGKSALSAWRRYIRQEQADAKRAERRAA